jgi:transposase
MTDELQRQININIQLRRQLEKCRKDTVEYCAKWCEGHEVFVDDRGNISVVPAKEKYIHKGDYYAEGLRGIIGK